MPASLLVPAWHSGLVGCISPLGPSTLPLAWHILEHGEGYIHTPIKSNGCSVLKSPKSHLKYQSLGLVGNWAYSCYIFAIHKDIIRKPA